MAQIVHNVADGHVVSSRASRFAATIVVAGVTLLVFAAAASILLWMHYGTAVFFEMIVAGINACV